MENKGAPLGSGRDSLREFRCMFISYIQFEMLTSAKTLVVQRLTSDGLEEEDERECIGYGLEETQLGIKLPVKMCEAITWSVIIVLQ